MREGERGRGGEGRGRVKERGERGEEGDWKKGGERTGRVEGDSIPTSVPHCFDSRTHGPRLNGRSEWT